MPNSALYLSTADLEDLAEPAEYVDVVRDAYRQRGDGVPANVPNSITTDEPDSDITSYTAMLPEMGVMGGYIYSVGANDGWFITPLFDIESGEVLAILDGTYWNPLKTGAVAAVGTEALARESASSVGVIGTSRVARGVLKTVATVRDIEQIRVYSRTPENRTSFADGIDGDFAATVSAVSSSAEAVEDADIVVTATNADQPVFNGENLASGAHVNAMGQSGYEREIGVKTFERAEKYVPDLRERVFAHAVQERRRAAGGFLKAFEEGKVAENDIYAELGSVVNGTVPGRETADEITLLDSTGTGVETVAAAAMLYEKAKQQGLGTEIDCTSYTNATPGTVK